jgi:hypothetical protein
LQYRLPLRSHIYCASNTKQNYPGTAERFIHYRYITDPGQACSSAQAVLSYCMRDAGYVTASTLDIGRDSKGNKLSKQG